MAPQRLSGVNARAADLVTDMREIKHPFQAGIRAQRGMEF
jgi:cob(I)alamin adenosyltransferase